MARTPTCAYCAGRADGGASVTLPAVPLDLSFCGPEHRDAYVAEGPRATIADDVTGPSLLRLAAGTRTFWAVVLLLGAALAHGLAALVDRLG